jgi:ribosomal protein L11 methyltransferase
MRAFVLSVPAGEVELASDVLWSLGVQAIEERDPGPPTDDHIVELWTALGDDATGVFESVLGSAEGFPQRWRWRVVEVDETVVDSWRQHAVPSWITDDLVVTPAWVEAPTRDPAVTVLSIDPGAAFGLGDHPTTVLTARAVRGLVFPNAAVLDVGCGSGVISIVAARSGAAYVEAIDVAAAAVDATRANAARNGVDKIVRATTTPVDAVHGEFDVVAANILAPTLIALAPDLRRVVGPSGVLVTSGLLTDRTADVVDALAPMQVVDRLSREGWVALVLRH